MPPKKKQSAAQKKAGLKKAAEKAKRKAAEAAAAEKQEPAGADAPATDSAAELSIEGFLGTVGWHSRMRFLLRSMWEQVVGWDRTGGLNLYAAYEAVEYDGSLVMVKPQTLSVDGSSAQLLASQEEVHDAHQRQFPHQVVLDGRNAPKHKEVGKLGITPKEHRQLDRKNVYRQLGQPEVLKRLREMWGAKAADQAPLDEDIVELRMVKNIVECRPHAQPDATDQAVVDAVTLLIIPHLERYEELTLPYFSIANFTDEGLKAKLYPVLDQFLNELSHRASKPGKQQARFKALFTNFKDAYSSFKRSVDITSLLIHHTIKFIGSEESMAAFTQCETKAQLQKLAVGILKEVQTSLSLLELKASGKLDDLLSQLGGAAMFAPPKGAGADKDAAPAPDAEVPRAGS